MGKTYGNRLVKIVSMKVKVAPTVSGAQASADFEVVFERVNRAYTGQKEVTKEFPLSLALDSSGNLKGCLSTLDSISLALKKQICQEIGGASAWDATHQKCKKIEGTGSSDDDDDDEPAQTCADLTDENIRNRLNLSSTDEYEEVDSGLGCGAKSNAVKVERCDINNFSNYYKYATLGCCYEGGRLVPESGQDCSTYFSGSELKKLFCKKDSTNCSIPPPPSNPSPGGSGTACTGRRPAVYYYCRCSITSRARIRCSWENGGRN